jgi:long-chain acyl-CoA synthetase
MQQYKTIDEIFSIASQEKYSNELFADFFGEKVTYKRLIEDSNKFCAFLQVSELKKGDKIVLSSSNDYYTSLFFISFLKYGIVTVLLDPESPAVRAKSIIEKVNAVAYVMDEKLFSERGINLSQHKANLSISAQTQKKGKLFNQLLKNKKTEHPIINNQFPEILNNLEPSSSIINKIEKDDLAYIIFTSGTTSAPKGVMITHENLFSHLETLSNVYKFSNATPIRIHNILMLYNLL